jgi:hypothetical protein
LDFIRGSAFASWLIAHMKPSLIPQGKTFGGIIRVNKEGEITHNILDINGVQTQCLTSVIEYKSHLILGSLHNDFVGFINLDKINSSNK